MLKIDQAQIVSPDNSLLDNVDGDWDARTGPVMLVNPKASMMDLLTFARARVQLVCETMDEYFYATVEGHSWVNNQGLIRMFLREAVETKALLEAMLPLVEQAEKAKAPATKKGVTHD